MDLHLDAAALSPLTPTQKAAILESLFLIIAIDRTLEPSEVERFNAEVRRIPFGFDQGTVSLIVDKTRLRTKFSNSKVQWSAWIKEIADAPETYNEAVARAPEIAQLLDQLKAAVPKDQLQFTFELDQDFLGSYVMWQAIMQQSTSAKVFGMAEEQMKNPYFVVFDKLARDPQYAKAWATLLAHVRKGDVVRVHSLRRGSAEALETVVHGAQDRSRVIGRRVEEIDMPNGAAIVALVRGEKVMIAHHDTLIETEDHVIVFLADRRQIDAVQRLFQSD